MKMKVNYLLLILGALVISSMGSEKVIGRVVEIEPVALEIVLPVYDRVILLMIRNKTDSVIDTFENVLQPLLKN